MARMITILAAVMVIVAGYGPATISEAGGAIHADVGPFGQDIRARY